MKTSLTRLATLLAAALPALAQADAPRYLIQDLGAVAPLLYSQAFGVSTNGNYAIGRSLYIDTNSTVGSYWPASIYNATTHTLQGQASLSAARPWAWGYDINDAGVGVGVSATSTTGSGALPTMWVNGTATAITMPAGQTVGRAYAINNAGIAVGSVGGGVSEVGVIYNTATGTSKVLDSVFTAQGSYMQTAFGISDNGLVVGAGVDSGNHGVMLVYDNNNNTMIQLAMPAYAGVNSALAFNISPNGQYVVGSSGNGSQPVIWSATSGAVVATLPAISSSGLLRDVNDQGWAVGSSGGQYSNPFLYADGQTYLMSDIITNGTGWNFTTTTSASADGIANNGTIIGTAQFNGIEHMYMATLAAAVPEPGTYALMAAGLLAVGTFARRRA